MADGCGPISETGADEARPSGQRRLEHAIIALPVRVQPQAPRVKIPCRNANQKPLVAISARRGLGRRRNMKACTRKTASMTGYIKGSRVT